MQMVFCIWIGSEMNISAKLLWVDVCIFAQRKHMELLKIELCPTTDKYTNEMQTQRWNA